MSKKTISQLLYLSDFEMLAAELKPWRTNQEQDETERKKGSELILGFVKGLRLSARLIYALRKYLSEFPVEVDWGHLINQSQDSISPECDIIIHEKGCIAAWNGTEKPVMDFKFVKCDQAIAVISCKSSLHSIDKKYYDRLKPYIKYILLFAECCAPNKIIPLKSNAIRVGYTGLWHLYSFDKETGKTDNLSKEWDNFLETLKRICEKKHGKQKSRKSQYP